MSTLPLPVTITVAERGAVLVEAATRVVAMSPFSERARRLAEDFGVGTHAVRTAQDVEDLPTGVEADLAECLA